MAVLDEEHRAGWLMMSALVEGQSRCIELMASPFLDS